MLVDGANPDLYRIRKIEASRPNIVTWHPWCSVHDGITSLSWIINTQSSILIGANGVIVLVPQLNTSRSVPEFPQNRSVGQKCKEKIIVKVMQSVS